MTVCVSGELRVTGRISSEVSGVEMGETSREPGCVYSAAWWFGSSAFGVGSAFTPEGRTAVGALGRGFGLGSGFEV